MPALPALWDIDWLNANSQRAYPLHEEASGEDTTGTFRLPKDFIVDLNLPVPVGATLNPTLFHVLSVDIFGAGVRLVVGYNGTPVAATTIDATTFDKYNSYALAGSGDYEDCQGAVTIGALETIMKSAGAYTFAVAAGRLEAAVLKPNLRGVSGIFIKNGDELIGPIRDDLVLEAGQNMSLVYQQRAGTAADPHVVTMSAIDGAGLNQECDCEENAAKTPIYTINGVGPDAGHNLVLQDTACIKFTAITNGLKAENPCATPCCGCKELEVVTTAVTFMQNQLNALLAMATQLEGQVVNLEANLASAAGPD
jgi:hypothetical protein